MNADEVKYVKSRDIIANRGNPRASVFLSHFMNPETLYSVTRDEIKNDQRYTYAAATITEP